MYSLSDWREFQRLLNYQPNPTRGAYARKSQKKRRLAQRRAGRRRRK